MLRLRDFLGLHLLGFLGRFEFLAGQACLLFRLFERLSGALGSFLGGIECAPGIATFCLRGPERCLGSYQILACAAIVSFSLLCLLPGLALELSEFYFAVSTGLSLGLFATLAPGGARRGRVERPLG